MGIAKFISLALKIKKVFKSSGKGVLGLSKAIVGIMILVLPLFGLDRVVAAIAGNEAGLATAISDIIAGVGVIMATWGIYAKQDKIEKLEHK